MPLQSFDALWNYARPGETETQFRALLPALEVAAEPGPLVELLTQIARTLGLQLAFDDAHALLDRADETLASAAGGSDLTPALARARLRCLLERGRVFNSSGAVDRAAPLFLEASDVALALGEDYHAVDAAHMMEIVESGEAKLDWNARAVARAEASTDSRARRWLGALYNNRGWTLFELGRADEALASFEQRLEWLEANPPEEASARERHETDLDIARWSIARMSRALDRVDEALVLQRALLETERGQNDGFVHEEMAECLLALGRADEARPCFARAHALLLLDPWFVRNEAARLERLRQMGER